ncbi:glycosyltransferase family 4 protein [Hyunsoonleella pacifica]|uniref:Glycosyltransferase n=1 Tax=Hyunsoonleella pacifica TaxID=1080224 RepID=A0A4Q9FS84_9FLAO|nr:glycosyltransferase family 4 protein [Hyunsoonleella pacifica]TBN18530.1 glycosyltransferase [Hyunsoonleella pacifica]GGD02548.1 hypothetical protein GCM10011368_00470 [Hyunsoonleella pacifica]
MKTLIYIGNKLSHSGKTVTSIETLGRFLSNSGYNVITSSSKTNKYFRLLDMVITLFRHYKADYALIDVYSTSNFYFAYIISQLCRFLKIRYIPILRGGNLDKRLKKSPVKSAQIFKNAHINIAPSSYLLSYFKETGYQNLIYIPNTIKINKYQFKTRNFDTIRLLWVRSFSKIYNPKLAIYILKSFRDKNIAASLCMVGPENDGSLSEVKALAKSLNLDVEFTGKLSKEAWHKKAENFNVFINTTNVDNTPVSVIEAMALGLPVVSTNVGGLPFLIKNNSDGILVKPNNAEEFKNAILELKNTPLLTQQIVSNARNKVEGYDWEIVKKQWMFILS